MAKLVERPSFVITWLVGWALAIGFLGWWFAMRVANHERGMPEYILDGLGLLAVAWFAVASIRRLVRRKGQEESGKAP